MTIVDIAKEAGYSVSTVSRVLNGRRDVSEEARDRIMLNCGSLPVLYQITMPSI